MATQSTQAHGSAGARRQILWIGAGLALLIILLIVWLAELKTEERRQQLHNLIEKQRLQTSEMAQAGRIVADLVFGELRQAFRAPDLPAGVGTGDLRQEDHHYEYLYGRLGETQNIERLLIGNLVGLVPAATDSQLARLQKVLAHLFDRDLNILVHPWSSRVVYSYWMSKDQTHVLCVPRWDFAAAIANSPLKTAQSAMGELADAMLTPYISQIKPGTLQIFRTSAWIDSTDGRALQTMVSPMFDRKGEWLGNAAVDFALDEIDRMLSQSGLEQAQWLLVTKDHTVLARHVNKQGPLAALLWGKPLSAASIVLPLAKDGIAVTAGDYLVHVTAVPGSNLHLYLVMPSKWLYQDLAVLAGTGLGALILLGFGMLMTLRYQQQREQTARARIEAAEALAQREKVRHERSLQLNAWSGKLAHALQQESEDLARFAQALLGELVPELGATVAAFFLRTPGTETFRCVAGFNITAQRCLSFQLGEGLAGAAALSQQVSICQDIPAGYLAVTSGTLDLDPIAITMIPVRIGEAVQALIEVGYLQLPREQDHVLAEAMPVIAFSLELFLRKQATLVELRQRAAVETRQRLILGSMQDGLFGQDIEGQITFVNAAALRMLGYTEAELIGRVMHATVQHHYADGRDFPRENRAMFQTLQDGQARTVVDEVFWRKNGSWFPVEYTTTALLEGGVLAGVVISFRDVTERKQIQKEIQDAKQQLEIALKSAKFAPVPGSAGASDAS
jgi:PAS domain S-box-containing protein